VPIGAEAIVRTGGGGWGNPLERDPARVWEDVAEGLVSAAAARKLYGVVLRRDRSLDERATNELRERLRSAQAASTKRSARPKAASKKPDEDARAQAGTVTIAPRPHRRARAARRTFSFNQMIDWLRPRSYCRAKRAAGVTAISQRSAQWLMTANTG
jgi:hypothetical protein